ncbi:MAG: EAL domain-containing protein [Rhodocyclaceae bacterium]
MISRLPAIALLAALYALVGWAALFLAIPPGYSVPVFPAAGIALCTLLVLGRSLWPGVFLGSLAVHLLAMHNTGALDDGAWAALVPAAGAALQAVIGATAAKRWIGIPNRLDAPGPILRLLAVVAPLSSLISPSIGIASLAFAGVMPRGDLGFNWWNWWIGDTLGVILVVPVFLALFGQPRSDWASRRVGILVPMGLALVLVSVAFNQVRNWEALRVSTQLGRDAQHIGEMVRKRLDVQVDMMRAIERLFLVSDLVTRREYRDFVMPWLDRYPGTQNFGWSPLVNRAERNAHERAMRANGWPDFEFLTRDPQGHTVRAPLADEYLPITYVEPLLTNLSVLGLNPLSFPATAEAIARTRVDGQPAVSEAFRLVQETGEQRGVVVYLAVHGRVDHPEQAQRLLGVVSGVFRMDDTMAAAHQLAQGTGLWLCLVDLDAAPGNRRLSGPADCDGDAWADGLGGRRLPLDYAGRSWELRLHAQQRYLNELRSWAAWSTAAVGLLAVGMLGAFLLITTGNTRRIAALVDERTQALEQASNALRSQQQALEDAQRLARMGSWQAQEGMHGILVSDQLCAVLARDRHTLTGIDDLLETLASADRERLAAAIADLRRHPAQATLDCVLRDAPHRALQFHVESEWHDGQLHRLRGTVQDVTAEREAEAHIHYLAHFDPLTGLPNRSAWITQAHNALQSAHRHGERIGILFLDLDHFKNVNDSLGHSVGDRLLGAAARRLAGSLREEDLLARLGGDEFVALLPRLHRMDDAAVVARKLLAALAHPIDLDGHEIAPSVSIGIALYPEDGEDVDTLLKHADTAMYGAKAAGRNSFQFFVPEMNARALERLMLETALRKAIERDQLVLHYQPQIDARSGLLSGCEALVRWRHPELGEVLPAQFIPVAEDSGLIVALGEWVLRAACIQARLWADTPLAGLTVSVNISALQFRQPDFPERVREIIADTGACAQRIELEITESALMQPSESLGLRLEALRAAGLRLALDDFGTGYSSLSYLKRLPINRLKIDRGFVRDLPGKTEDAAIASATLSLGRDLGIEIVAEGVETEAQRDYLVSNGCDALQGYLFARPLPAADFERWAHAWNNPSATLPAPHAG